MKTKTTKRVEIKVIGQVQGVFFRAGIKDEAERLDLTGWARNETEGSVRIVTEGTEENLQKLVEWCRKGTRWATVYKVTVDWKEANSEFKNFEVR